VPRAPARPLLARLRPEDIPPGAGWALHYAQTGEGEPQTLAWSGSEQAALRDHEGVVALACRARNVLAAGLAITPAQLAAIAGLSDQAVTRHARAGLRLDDARAVRAWLAERETAAKVRASRRRAIGRRT
jgi:hypothetical protein